MRYRQLLQLIAQGEGLNCEFKLHFSNHEKIAKEFIAFANTSGGYVLFGIDDDGRIAGVQSEKGEAELIADTIKNFCEPVIKYEIHYFDIEGKEIVVVHIPESEDKPHRIQDYQKTLDVRNAQVYVRVNDKSIPASKEMIRIMRSRQKGDGLYKYSIGDLEKEIFRYLEKNETITVKECCSLLNLSGRRAARTLVKLVRAGALTLHLKDSGEEYYSIRSEIQN